MSDYFIKIDKTFSTSFFYERVLGDLHECISDGKKPRVIFDLSETTFVDALVIPNFLCTGYLLKDWTGNVPIITTLSKNYYSSRFDTAKYLYDIGFSRIAQDYNLFEINDFGNQDKESLISEYSRTYLFNDFNVSKQDIARTISQKSKMLFEKHLRNYFADDEIFGYCNIFAKFAAELCNNSLVHGKSFSIMTIQSNVKLGKVSIAVSDCGCGFYNSLCQKIITNEAHDFYTIDKNDFMKNTDTRSLNAIIESTFYRYFDKVYGIWDIANTVFKHDGTIRIHSSDSRIVLTPRTFQLIFEVCKDPESLKRLLVKEFVQKKDYNFKSGMRFKGVHYEIEIPFNTEKRRGAYENY